MPKPSSNIFKKVILTLGVIAFTVVGYLGANVATSCKANAQCICSPCIAPGSYPIAITTISVSTVANIASATAQYLADLAIKAPIMGQAVVAQVNISKTHLTDWYDTFWSYNLKPAMQAMTSQLNARDVWQTQTLAAFQDAMNVNRTHLAMMEAQLESYRETRVSENLCQAATVSGRMTFAEAFRRAFNVAATIERTARSVNSILTKSFSSQDEELYASNNPLVKPAYAAVNSAAQGAAADMRDRWQHYLTNYCDFRTNSHNSGCKTDGPYKNRDLDVTREIFGKPTIDVTDKATKMVVDDILVNLAEPFALDPISQQQTLQPEFQERLLKRRPYLAKRQAIYDALYFVVARRIPASGGGTSTNFLGEIRDAAGVSPSMISANPSYNEIMQTMMSERFRSGSYSVEQIDEPENNEREMVIQQAFQAMQLNDQLELLDRFATVLAGQVGTTVSESKRFEDKSKDAALK